MGPFLEIAAASDYDKAAPLRKRARLTPRQREIMTWIAQGKSSWEIAIILGIAERTVNEHLNAARLKLGAVNRAQAIAIAVRDRLIII